LIAALEAEMASHPVDAARGSKATVPVPQEHVDALVAVLRKGIAAGKGDGFAVPIPDAWYVTGRGPVVGEDGVTPVVGADGTPVTHITSTQAWATAGNPAEHYARAARKALCACAGGDGSAVWVGQWSEPIETGPKNAEGKRKRVNVRGAVVLRTAIPKAAKVAPEFEHLKAV
jgi:hypothetical protein